MKQNNKCRYDDGIVSEKITDMILSMNDETLQMFADLLELRQKEIDLTRRLVSELSGNFAGVVNAVLKNFEGEE